MDLVSSCKDKLAYFRIKELKDVLNQLGLVRQGKKQDLVDRILAALSDEGSKLHGWTKKNSIGKEAVAKIIDDTYRKMQVHGATDLASKFQNGSDSSNLKPKEEIDDSFQLDMKVRCPCGSSLLTDSMIKCEDPRCHVWQHISCVIIPERPTEGVLPEVPTQFYCEICRINRADPFWVTLAHPLPPVKMTVSNIPTDGTNPVQNVEKTFQLTRADRDLLQKQEYDLQAWCILLNDKVPFRMQWPQYVDLQVNGVPIRTTNRPGSQLLGTHGRDDGPAITTCSREGMNKISLSACDARIFCLGVRIARRRTLQQVLNLIPKETDGECFEEALARVCRCISGGGAQENADSDSDLEVVADSVTVNLRCPMSGSRMKVAGRFKPCVHMGCFDLKTFVELNQRSRKWQCPICMKNYSLENIIIDPYFNRIVSLMHNCGEDVTEIDVKPDGSWRAKNENDNRDLAQWHFPDGSLCIATEVDIKPDQETLRQIKQGVSDGQTSLKLGIKRNRNGIWEVSKPEDVRALSSGNHATENFESHCQKVVPMSSSATGSWRDGEDASVNQEGGGHFDFSTNNGNELDSISLNVDATYSNVNRIPTAPLTDEEIIVLSDSEDNGNVNILSPETGYDVGTAGDNVFPIPTHGVMDYPEDSGLGAGGNTGLDLFNANGDEYGMWHLPPCQVSGFQLFGTDTNDPDVLVDAQDSSIPCPSTMNGFGLATDANVIADTSQAQNLSICQPHTEINEGLVDNPLAFDEADPSLQIFLPTGPVGASVQANMRDHTDASNGGRTEDLLSLRLGGGGCRVESPSTDGLHSRNQFPTEESRIDSVANSAALLLSMNDNGAARATSTRPRSDGPFSHPRQPRSAQQRFVRPRLYLSIDTDSE
eukprot:TRINITY_DN8983_c0_g1_i2.p1 TRINITY_DN8983_c0_g1~~TRINITY_DN8983_c0_g1_i2.p1  ORF type:complete len:879 (-),score=190.81 TRINITY_DN8983_c0_g1_i2:706-3342(-)